MSQLDPFSSRVVGPVAQREALEAEQTLLGTIMLHPDKMDVMADIMLPGDFVEPLHAHVWQAMLDRHNQGETVTISGITARMGDQSLGNGQTLRQYLAQLTVQYSSTAQAVDGTARAVRDAAGMRELQLISEELTEQLRLPGIHDPLPLATELVAKADQIIATGLVDTSRPMTMGQASRLALQNALQAREGRTKPGIPYGIPRLDEMTNGMRGGQLIILAGRPAMGKTAVGITIGLSAGHRDVAVFNASLEMVATDLAERALSAEAYLMGREVPYERISAGIELSDEDVAILIEAQERIDRMPYHIEQRSGLTLAQLASGARRFFATQREKGRKDGLLVIDYLGLVKASERYGGQRVNEVGEVTRGLKALAKELGVPVILLCQLNRSVEGRDDKHPILSDLRDSGDIEQDADVVLFVYRDEYYLNMVNAESLSGDELSDYSNRLSRNMNVLEIGVAKQRKGRTGWIRNYCDIACNFVRELRGE